MGTGDDERRSLDGSLTWFEPYGMLDEVCTAEFLAFGEESFLVLSQDLF